MTVWRSGLGGDVERRFLEERGLASRRAEIGKARAVGLQSGA